MELDYLVLAAHPDDAELHVAGTLIKMRQLGRTVGVLDFSRGEAGSAGSVEERDRETAAATRILGLHFRENLGLPDGALANDHDTRVKVVNVIRRLRVKVLIAPQPPCRHPDHEAVGALARAVMFYSGNGQYPADHQPWRPHLLMQHFENREADASLVIDITAQWEARMQAFYAYRSQFWNPDRGETGTYVGSKLFHDRFTARFRLYGAQIGVPYGEPFVLEQPVAVHDPLHDLEARS